MITFNSPPNRPLTWQENDATISQISAELDQDYRDLQAVAERIRLQAERLRAQHDQRGLHDGWPGTGTGDGTGPR